MAFWYQLEPHRPFEPLPVGNARLHYDWSKIIEAETLLEQSIATGAPKTVWGGGYLSDDGQLILDANAAGATLEIPFEVTEAGDYRLVLAMVRNAFSGLYTFAIDGQGVGRPIDLYHPDLSQREYALDAVALEPGTHMLKATAIAKNHRSTGYLFGLDGFLVLAE